MSITKLSAQDVKLFGFEFLYVWNEFKNQYPDIVDAIQKQTVEEFGQIIISKQHIANKTHCVLIDK